MSQLLLTTLILLKINFRIISKPMTWMETRKMCIYWWTKLSGIWKLDVVISHANRFWDVVTEMSNFSLIWGNVSIILWNKHCKSIYWPVYDRTLVLNGLIIIKVKWFIYYHQPYKILFNLYFSNYWNNGNSKEYIIFQCFKFRK